MQGGPPPAAEQSASAHAPEPSVSSPALSGFKSELAADEPQSARSDMTAASTSSPGHYYYYPSSSPASSSQQQQQRYSAYDPRVHGDYAQQQKQQQQRGHSGVSEMSAAAPASPSHQPGQGDPLLRPVSELPG